MLYSISHYISKTIKTLKRAKYLQYINLLHAREHFSLALLSILTLQLFIYSVNINTLKQKELHNFKQETPYGTLAEPRETNFII